MKTIVIEFSGDREYADRCINDALARGEAPLLGRLLCRSPSDDTTAAAREREVAGRYEISAKMDMWVFYLDRGVTTEMLTAIDAAVENGFRPYYEVPSACVLYPEYRPIVFRTFDPELGYRHSLHGLENGTRSDSGEIRLHECTRWPSLLVQFEKHARREWDLPR